MITKNQKEKEGTGYDFDSAMVESVTADVIQILTQEELKSLKSYVEKQDLPIDLRALEEEKAPSFSMITDCLKNKKNWRRKM